MTPSSRTPITLRAEPLALAGLLVDALVVDARRLHRDRARPDRHSPLPGAAVAHHQPLAIRVALVGEALDVIVGLGLQRSRDHPASALARELIQHDRELVVLPGGEPANIIHGVPSFAASRRSVLINRGGTPPSSSGASTTSGYSSTAASRCSPCAAAYQEAMSADCIAAIEQLAGRTVIAFMSANHLDTDLAAEIFVLERQAPPAA